MGGCCCGGCVVVTTTEKAVEAGKALAAAVADEHRHEVGLAKARAKRAKLEQLKKV
jgi:ribulose kinase